MAERTYRVTEIVGRPGRKTGGPEVRQRPVCGRQIVVVEGRREAFECGAGPGAVERAILRGLG